MGFFDSVKTLIKSDDPKTQPTAPTATPLKKVLVVDDDENLRFFYLELLKGEGFNAIGAENGQVGLDTINSQKPDAVLLDLMMPVMDGKTMLHTIRQIPEFKYLPVIVLTNAGTSDNMKDTKFYDNADDFLIKSNVTPDEIIQKVKSLLMV